MGDCYVVRRPPSSGTDRDFPEGEFHLIGRRDQGERETIPEHSASVVRRPLLLQSLLVAVVLLEKEVPIVGTAPRRDAARGLLKVMTNLIKTVKARDWSGEGPILIAGKLVFQATRIV